MSRGLTRRFCRLVSLSKIVDTWSWIGSLLTHVVVGYRVPAALVVARSRLCSARSLYSSWVITRIGGFSSRSLYCREQYSVFMVPLGTLDVNPHVNVNCTRWVLVCEDRRFVCARRRRVPHSAVNEAYMSRIEGEGWWRTTIAIPLKGTTWTREEQRVRLCDYGTRDTAAHSWLATLRGTSEIRKHAESTRQRGALGDCVAARRGPLSLSARYRT